MIAVAVALPAAQRLATTIGGKLRKNEKELVEASFKEAIFQVRREQRRVAQGEEADAGLLKRNLEKVVDLPPVGGAEGPDEAGVTDGLKHLFSAKRIAKQLTTSLYAAFVDPPSSDLTDRPNDDSNPWHEALVGFLREAAQDGAGGKGKKERGDWSWVLCGVGDKEPSVDDFRRWADEMAGKVAAKWREKIPWLVSHIRHGAEHEAMRTLVETSREIARNTLLWFWVGIPVLLLGGGGVALLVLFIDKG